MALPLPRVVADIGPGGGILGARNAINAFRQNQSAADYAPYTNYANAASKLAYSNMLPYQVQATVMSNPMMWMALKDDPQALRALMSNFKNSIPQGNNIFGDINLPKPQSMGQNPFSGGLFDMIKNIVTKGNPFVNQYPQNMAMQNQQGQNVMPQMPIQGQSQGQGSPLVPATQGGMQGILGKQTAPYVTAPYKPGSLIQDPNNPTGTISVPTNETTTAAQNAIAAVERVTPQLQELADAAAPFMSFEGKITNQIERFKNALNPASKNPGKLPTQYAKFNSLIQSAPESLVKSYGLRPTNETIERMQKVIEPYFGETPDQYKQRILKQLQSLKEEQGGVSKKTISQGFNLNENSPSSKVSTVNKKSWPANKEAVNENQLEGQALPAGTIWMIRPDGMKVPVHKSQESVAKNKYNFRGV